MCGGEEVFTQARILPGLTWRTSVEDMEFLLSDVRRKPCSELYLVPSFIQAPVVLFQEHTEDPTVNAWALCNLLRSRTVSGAFLLPPFWLLVPPSSVDFGLTIVLSPSVVGWMFN